jgi:diguanylate cyclase (GGDEF)-like protein
MLSCAFASTARHSQTPVSNLWLTGWLTILLHFAALLFLHLPGIWGALATTTALASLTWAGALFMWAAVPYHSDKSSLWIFVCQLATNTFYIGVLMAGPVADWALNPAAALFGICPLVVLLVSFRTFNPALRWFNVTLNCSLSIFLLLVQHRPANGASLAMNGVLFAIFFGCSTNFFWVYRRATAGAFITIAGFFTWASVFVVAPFIESFFPLARVESEVWNLPKYLVSAGMILLLLEDQIEHNKHLALHDELTDLPNRRLFQDRLAIAIERARRSETQAALLVIDLDRFKHVNDTMGHHIGDLLLIEVGSAFVGRVRRSDTVARTGGDEFSLILEEPTCRADAEQVGQSLLQLLDEPLLLDGHLVRIGASVGIAMFPEDASNGESLCIAADLRMYEDKEKRSRSIERPVSSRAVPFPSQNLKANSDAELAQ